MQEKIRHPVLGVDYTSTTRARGLLFYRLLEHAVQTDLHKSNERGVDTPLNRILENYQTHLFLGVIFLGIEDNGCPSKYQVNQIQKLQTIIDEFNRSGKIMSYCN